MLRLQTLAHQQEVVVLFPSNKQILYQIYYKLSGVECPHLATITLKNKRV